MPDQEVPGLHFGRVEVLRKHMLLTVTQIAKLFSISRVTYTGWVSGKPIRKGNDERVRIQLRKMLKVMKDGWPSEAVQELSSPKRFDRLLELMKEQA